MAATNIPWIFTWIITAADEAVDAWKQSVHEVEQICIVRSQLYTGADLVVEAISPLGVAVCVEETLHPFALDNRK